MKMNDTILSDDTEFMSERVASEAPYEEMQEEEGKSIVEILKTPTGEGDIESYIDEPLNFNKSPEVAQILRGLSGFVGTINLAILDIVIGAYRIFKKKGTQNA